jgi:two-component system, OmpR family, response regulator VicR
MAQTILIAEDEPSLLKLLTKKISSMGYTVETASDGEQAINKLKTRSIALVLLDIIMPKKNGLQVLQELRVNLNSKVPVIILSNLEKDEDTEAGKSYGVYDYIIKSHISMRELSNKVVKALAGE